MPPRRVHGLTLHRQPFAETREEIGASVPGYDTNKILEQLSNSQKKGRILRIMMDEIW